MRRRFRLLISGSFAVLAAVSCLLYGEQTREEAERERAEALARYGGEVVRLVVAKETIEAGETVNTTNVTEKDWLSDLAPSGAITALDDVAGAVVSVPVSAGMPLTELNFRDEEDAVDVPAGRVALSVPLSDDAGIASSLAVGTTIAAYEVSDSGVNLLADDLQVLAVPFESGRVLSSGSVTVSASPDKVASILASSGKGSLRLVLPGEGALDSGQGSSQAPTEVPAEQSEGAEGT